VTYWSDVLVTYDVEAGKVMLLVMYCVDTEVRVMYLVEASSVVVFVVVFVVVWVVVDSFVEVKVVVFPGTVYVVVVLGTLSAA
jgi:hypothetical protein